MPAGLDGHPDPVVSDERSAVLAHLTTIVGTSAGRPRLLVGIDGASGTGKSTLADELTGLLQAAGHVVVRSTIDSFHRPRAERYRRGATSAEGYYRDSHDLRRGPARTCSIRSGPATTPSPRPSSTSRAISPAR